MRRVRFTGAGGNEVIRLETSDDPELGESQVLVGARYVGVNPLDVLQRSGRYPVPAGMAPHLPGVEVAGSVLAVGARVTRWSEGDRVMGLVAEAGLADRVLAHQDHLLSVPEGIPDVLAASLPEAVITAFDALDRARTGLRDVVAVRGVNGGVGLASYQLAAAMGAVPVGIARSREVVEKLARLGFSAVTDDECLATLAKMGGASVLIDLVGGHFLGQDLSLLASGGRVVAVSVAAGEEALLPVDVLLGKRVDLMGTVLRPRSTAEKALLIRRMEEAVLPLLAEGQLTIPVERIFAANDVADAFDHLGRPGKVGKVLLDFGDGSRERVNRGAQQA